MKMRIEKTQLIRLIVICIIINGFFISIITNSSFENSAVKINESLNEDNFSTLNSRSTEKIIDLNKDTKDIHHNVTIYGAGMVLAVGDVNNDSIDDFIIRTGSNGPNGQRTRCGAVCVMYGNTTQSPIYNIKEDYDLIIYGIDTYDDLGDSAAVGDVNNDGINDIVIGAEYGDGDTNLRVTSGEVYVFYGNGSLPLIWDLKSTPANVTIYGIDAWDRLGQSLICGDINADGIDDIIMTAEMAKGPNNTRVIHGTMGCGEVYVIYGNSSLPKTLDLSGKYDMKLYGADARDNIGASLAVGDVNSDGISDLIMGAPFASGYKNGRGFGGEVYVIFGNETLPSTVDLLSDSTDIIIYPFDMRDKLGSRVASGDINGDKIDDIIMSAPESKGAKNKELYVGEVWVVYGNKSLKPIINSTDVDVIIYGRHDNATMGRSIAVGDVNGDKFDDLIIGACRTNGPPKELRMGAGECYLLYSNGSWGKKIDLDNALSNATIYGADEGDWTGTDLFISDINGDDKNDIIICSQRGRGRNNEGVTTGETYILLSGGEVLSIPVIELLKLENGGGDDDKVCYAEYSIPYIFRIRITTPNDIEDLKSVSIAFAQDWAGINLHCTWTKATGEFTKTRDPRNFIEISDKSKFKNDGNNTWDIYFYLIFNGSFPSNQYHIMQVHSVGNSNFEDWLNLTSDMFMVETRFDLFGDLTVNSEYLGEVSEYDWVRGGEKLNWSGLSVVYYGTEDVYPPTEVDLVVTIWDSIGNNWSWQHVQNEMIAIQTVTLKETKLNETYTINISNLPWWLDQTDIKFKLNIDFDQPTYTNVYPDDITWHASLRPLCGIQINDSSTNVDSSTVQYRISTDPSATWTNWSSLGLQYEFYGNKLNCTVRPIFSDGVDNHIQWRVRDIVGNPYSESEIYQIRTDISNVTFTDPEPSPDDWQKNITVTCGITVNDPLSGVNASSIEYSTSISGIWEFGDWQSARKTINGKSIQSTITPTFSGGTDNYIRWRAKDVVGNGHRISDNYQIKVKINHPPTTTLISPQNNSLINILIPELVWEGMDPDNDTKLRYRIFLSSELDKVISQNKTILIKSIINETRYKLEVPLENGETYYWTVIPNDGILNGTCMSGYSKFRIDTSVEVPKVTLLEPEDESLITTKLPKLSWKLNYSNSDIVGYNIYFSKSSDYNLISKEKLYKKDYKLTTFEFDKPLTPGENYYWTVIPIAKRPEGNLEGICQSGIWSFKVELPEEKIYGLELKIETQKLKIMQGNYSSMNISVTNKGNTADTVEVSYDKGILDANVGLENSSSPIWLEKNDSIRLKLEILVSEDAKPQNYTVSITAISTGGLVEGKDISNVSVTRTFIVEVLEKAQELEDGEGKAETKESGIDYMIWSFLIILLILILAMFAYIYRSRRVPYVKSELLAKPPYHLRLPGVSGKPGMDLELPAAVGEEGAIALERAAIPVTYRLPKAVLTKDEELKLLREKFLLGDITEETYRELKTEIETSKDITKLDEVEPKEDDISTEEPPLDVEPLEEKDLAKEMEEEPESPETETVDVDVEEARVVEELEKELRGEIGEEEVDIGEEKISEPLITKKKPKIKKKKKAKRPKLKEKGDEGPVEELVAEDELSDIPEEAYPFPDDGLCITCGQSLDPDMAYCWSCGTKYELKKG